VSRWICKMSSSGSNAGMRLHHCWFNGTVNNSVPLPHQSHADSNHSHLELLVGSLLNYAPDVVNWIGVSVMAVRRYPDRWMHGGSFIQLWCMASLQTLQTKIATYDTHNRWLGETSLSQYPVCARPSWPSVTSSTVHGSHTFFIVYSLRPATA